jgi:hypothetical protein
MNENGYSGTQLPQLGSLPNFLSKMQSDLLGLPSKRALASCVLIPRCVTLQSDKLKKSSLCTHASQSAQPHILILGLKQLKKFLLPPIDLSKMSFEEILDAPCVSQDI